MALAAIAGTVVSLGLAILGWGGVTAFFAHPARVAVAAVTLALTAVALGSSGNLSPGEREDLANRWVLACFLALGLLHGVWLLRNVRRWVRVGPADTVFELCKVAPHVSGRVLAEFPDLLLYHRTEPDIDRDLGPVLVCTRGVVVGGQLAADPDAEVRQAKLGRFGGGYELTFGRHRIRRMPRRHGC